MSHVATTDHVPEWELTTYLGHGEEREAIQLPWEEVEAVLGAPHRGTPGEDRAIVDALLRAGAPAWAAEASGWVDEYGYGLYRSGKQAAARRRKLLRGLV